MIKAFNESGELHCAVQWGLGINAAYALLIRFADCQKLARNGIPLRAGFFRLVDEGAPFFVEDVARGELCAFYLFDGRTITHPWFYNVAGVIRMIEEAAKWA